MSKIISEFFEQLPELKLVGKKYLPSNNGYAHVWSEWFANDWFSKIEKLETYDSIENGYIGILKWDSKNMSNYEYWVGVFTKVNTIAPEGFDSFIIPKSEAFVCFIKGVDGPELYATEDVCFQKLLASEKKVNDSSGFCYAFERYNCPRFTHPDDNNEVILDFGIFVK